MEERIHDHDGTHKITCREHDAAVHQVTAALRLDAHRTAYRIGLYVGGIREKLKGEMPAADRQSSIAHLQEHEEWSEMVIRQLEADRR